MQKYSLLKKVLTAGATLLLMAGMSFGALASSNKATITNIALKFDTSDIVIGSSDKTIEVTAVNDNSYMVTKEEVSAINMDSSVWKSGMTPRFNITIKPEEGYKFDTNQLANSGYYTFSGSPVTFVKAKGGSSSITLTIKLDKIRGNADNLGVSDLEWGEDGTARWEPAETAEKYTVRLYRGSHTITTVETTSTSYNFASLIDRSGTYRFKVRTSAFGATGEWDTSDDLYVDEEDLPRFGGKGKGNANGKGAWLRDHVGWWYANADRSYTTNNWQKIDGLWYFFDSRGYMESSKWIMTAGKWYYVSSSGAMLANTTTPDGYRVGADGAWIQ